MTRRRLRVSTSRPFGCVLAAGLALALGQVLTSRPGEADVYQLVERGLSGLLADVVDTPERQPRDLMVNGQPLAFTPYHSARPADAVCRDWKAALAAHHRAAVDASGDPERWGAKVAADVLAAPKATRLPDQGCAVVQFFDGDGRAAMDYVLASSPARLKAGSQRPPMPGVTVMIRQAGERGGSDVLMSRFNDVPATLSAYAAPANVAALPPSLQPPAGATVLNDLGDRGTQHVSRTVVTSGHLSMAAWADMRRDLLARENFSIQAQSTSTDGLAAFQGRRGSVEADVHYSPGKEPGEVVEVIELREPQLAGQTP